MRSRIAAFLRTSQQGYNMALACGVGLLVGSASIVFHELLHLVQKMALGAASPLVALALLPWYWKVLFPAIGGFLVAPVVYRWAVEAKGHGVPEVMEAVALRGGVIRMRVALAKSVASAITIGTGGSAGREGPVVQIGSALGSTVGQLLRLSPERIKTLVGCGAAGGIAATFNAPIAGAFFALEVILGNFAVPTFAPIVLSSVIATAVSRAYLGNFPAFQVPQYSLVHYGEVPLYGLLGMLMGLIAVVFILALYKTEDLFERSPIPPLARTVAGGFVVGLLLLVTPEVYGTGFEAMYRLLHETIGWKSLTLLLLAKLAATCFTLGSGASGGIFSPSLFLGAVAGGLFGQAVHAVFPGMSATPEAYAMVGMGAVVAGTTHAPVTAILILFELTGDYQIILPVMIACTLSTLVARWLKEDSIYSLKLARRGIDLRRREDVLMRAFKVEQVMRRDATPIRGNVPFQEIVHHFLENDVPVCFVVDEKNRMVGEISIHDVKAAFHEKGLGSLVIARDLANGDAVTATPTDTLADCMEKFAFSDQEYLPVLLPQSRELVGVISRRDVIDLYNREILRRDYLGLAVGGKEDPRQVQEYVHIPRDYRVEVVPVPREFAGKSLREIDLRASYNLTVVALKRGGGHAGDELPDPNRRLRAEDFLVLVGRKEDVERFLRTGAGAAGESAP